MTGKRIIFMGTPDFACPTLATLIERGEQVVAVVTQPDRPKGRGQQTLPPPVKVLAEQHGIPVFQPVKVRHPEAIEDDLRHPLEADSAEQAIDLADDEALASLDEVIRQEILQVRSALLRIENGTYGTCAACGDDIAADRLKALPTATRCISCA